MEATEQGQLFDELLAALPSEPVSREVLWGEVRRVLQILPEPFRWALADEGPVLFAISDDDALFTVSLKPTGSLSVQRSRLDVAQLRVQLQTAPPEAGDPDQAETFMRLSRWTFRNSRDAEPLLTLSGRISIRGHMVSMDRREEFAREIASRVGWAMKSPSW